MNKIDKAASYDDRIQQKEEEEKNLIERINKKQRVPLVKSGDVEDRGGVDAYYTLKGKRYTVALKTREHGSGDDLLVESVTPWVNIKSREDIKFTGRDLKSRADKYYFVDTKGVLRIADGDYVRNIVKEMTYEFVDKYLKTKERWYRIKRGMAIIQKDHSDQALYDSGKVDKLLVFINPKDIKIEYEVIIGL